MLLRCCGGARATREAQHVCTRRTLDGLVYEPSFTISVISLTQGNVYEECYTNYTDSSALYYETFRGLEKRTFRLGAQKGGSVETSRMF